MTYGSVSLAVSLVLLAVGLNLLSRANLGRLHPDMGRGNLTPHLILETISLALTNGPTLFHGLGLSSAPTSYLAPHKRMLASDPSLHHFPNVERVYNVAKKPPTSLPEMGDNDANPKPMVCSPSDSNDNTWEEEDAILLNSSREPLEPRLSCELLVSKTPEKRISILTALG